MSLQKNVKELDFDGQRVVLKRPGRGGISRIAVRISHRIQGDPTIAQLDGAGVEMEAILHEYLAEGPAEWRLKDSKGNPVLNEGKPVWTFEEADPDLFGRVGEAAVEFHRGFRDVDARFGVPSGELLGTARPVAGAGDAPVPGPGAA